MENSGLVYTYRYNKAESKLRHVVLVYEWREPSGMIRLSASLCEDRQVAFQTSEENRALTQWSWDNWLTIWERKKLDLNFHLTS